MRKDELKSGDYCPDCVEAGANSEPDTDECCCCCCSCSDCASEAESNDTSSATLENRVIPTLEQQKKDLLSTLTILRTNREQTSIQHVLQFVEALTYSTEFLKRYNLQEDFCMECLFSEPTCTCCTNGISQININDQSCDSCDECNVNEDSNRQAYPLQECVDYASSSKAPNPGRQRNRNRRERRQRRRQRNTRHNLPRVSTTFIPNNVPSSRNLQLQNSCDRNYSGDNEEARNCSQLDQEQVEILNHDENCEECVRESPRNIPHRARNQNEMLHHETLHHGDNCEECAREEVSRRGSRAELHGYPQSICSNTNDESESCEECARENLPSTSCTLCCSEDCESKSGVFGRNGSVGKEKFPECSCASCNNSIIGHEVNQRSTDKSKKQRVSDKPECDQNETCSEYSERGRSQSGECSCGDCRTISECSDESCDECRNERSKENKKK